MSDRCPVGALFTDLYEITMAQAYLASGVVGEAVFETSFRSLAPGRSYALAAGVGEVLAFLESLRFEAEDLQYLRGLGMFTDPFLDRLSELRFTGDVWAVPEGSVVFPNEPIVSVVAPITEGQLAETFVLNQIHLQTVIASKAARVVEAAGGREVVDFGSRRAHGRDAALQVARLSYLAGAAGTSNLLAARCYGIPAFGTMAHSFIQAFDDELEAFESFARLYPGTTLLVDTYDTIKGVEHVIEVARKLGEGDAPTAVRLDSGDLSELSKRSRALLDAAGLHRVKIFASSNLDEYSIAALIADGSPIDGFGVGTSLATSSDAPTLDLVYKLVEYEGEGRTKLSSHKTIYPGRKQIFRRSRGGVLVGDSIGRADEALEGEPLLIPMMKAGQRLPAGIPDLEAARRRARAAIASLPPELRSLDPPTSAYPVEISPQIERELDRARNRIASTQGGADSITRATREGLS